MAKGTCQRWRGSSLVGRAPQTAEARVSPILLRGALAGLALFAAASAGGHLAYSGASTTPADSSPLRVRRQLLLASLAPLLPSPAFSAVPVRELGTNFGVDYSAPPGDDFVLGGGGGLPTVPQYSARVLRVAPNGPAAQAGVRIGDEVAMVSTPNGKLIAEMKFRQAPKVDEVVKSEVTPGAVVVFRACGMVQPGEEAPNFVLPSADDKDVSLESLRAGNRKVVLFFRPGSRFFSGDIEELKFIARSQEAFAKLGANVAGITTDALSFQKRQARAAGASFPLLSDPKGEVAQGYGTLLTLPGVREVVDRKTYIIGADGRVEAVFPAVGWEVGQVELADHFAELAAALGGDPEAMKAVALPRQRTVGDVIALSQQR